MLSRDAVDRRILYNDPGFSGVYAVTQRGRTIASSAIGFQGAGRLPNRTDTRFAMASGSKAFTALAILKLCETGRIALDDTVSDRLPGRFLLIDNRVTVRHLLTHTSGFRDYFDESVPGASYADVWKTVSPASMTGPDSFLPLLRDGAMEFPPGERFKYNNGGYVILAMLIEQAIGVSFNDYVKETVLEPLGMNGSGYFRMDALPENTAAGYTGDGRGGLMPNTDCLPVVGGGDGGAFTTLEDMDRFWRGLPAGTVVAPGALAEVWSPLVPTGREGVAYGFGFWIDTRRGDVRKVHLMGGDPGVSFRSAYFPAEELVITAMCNRDTGSLAATETIENALSA